MKKRNLIGEQFGRLTVIAEAPSQRLSSGRSLVRWRCRCQCGNELDIWACALLSGGTRSCGCFAHELHVERGKNLQLKHGKDQKAHPTAEYRAWVSMKRRCYNPRARGYENYGGAGVTVCDAWKDSFEQFYADVGNKPAADYSLDRIDPFGNYEPSNCRWADKVTQSRNTRKRKTGGYKNAKV